MADDDFADPAGFRALLDTGHSLAGRFIDLHEYPWQVLPEIAEIILTIGADLPSGEYELKDGNIWISRAARVAPSASITGPVIIGPGADIRHCAFIRGSALVGEYAVVGNSTELKNVILFDRVQVPHYNYVGDSILGFRAHMGAGAITSNVKSDRTEITVKWPGGSLETGLKKFGAILGDFVEVGCNSVLNPGTIVGRNTNIYPLTSVRGYVPADSIMKGTGNIVDKR